MGAIRSVVKSVVSDVGGNVSGIGGFSWSSLMVKSYMTLNPEQSAWFNTSVVNTEADMFAIDTPVAGQWCYVHDVYGDTPDGSNSKEFVWDENIHIWVDSHINGKGFPTGRMARETLKTRLGANYAPDGTPDGWKNYFDTYNKERIYQFFTKYGYCEQKFCSVG